MEERSRPNLLYLVHRVPYPPDKGDRIRSYHLLKFLSRRANVYLACLADEPVPESTVSVLEQLCARVSIAPLGRWSRWANALGSLARGRTITEGAFRSTALTATLRRWVASARFDVALASASSMVPYLQQEELREVPAVIDLVDVDSQKWIDYAAATRGPRSWLYALEGRRLRELERRLPGWARAVTLVSDAEADLYRAFADPGEIHAVGNGVDLDYFQPVPPSDEPSCVFVGALDYRPNVDGACWFCREIWPEIRRRSPRAKVYLVGRRPAPAVRSLTTLPGVELVGQVQDVRPYVSRATVAVIPLRLARGVQNKVLEALAMGKATVASPQALAGLRVRPGTHLLAATSRQEWVDAIWMLWECFGLRRELGSAGRHYVEEHHYWDRCLEPLANWLSPLTSIPRQHLSRPTPHGSPA